MDSSRFSVLVAAIFGYCSSFLRYAALRNQRADALTSQFRLDTRVILCVDSSVPEEAVLGDITFLRKVVQPSQILIVMSDTIAYHIEIDEITCLFYSAKMKVMDNLSLVYSMTSFNPSCMVMRGETFPSHVKNTILRALPPIRISFGDPVIWPYTNIRMSDCNDTLENYFQPV